MKAEIYRQIKTTILISVDGVDFPIGTLGAIVETYFDPEGYAVDLAVVDPQLVGGFQYHHVILSPEQFELVQRNTEQEKFPEDHLSEKEDRGLAKLISEVKNDELLSKSEALAYLQFLKNDSSDNS